jgi:hypothetical protein
MIGSTDRSIPTSPGRHTLVLQRSGFEPGVRTVDVADGQTMPVAIELMPRAGKRAGAGDRAARPSQLWPIVVGGVGVVALGVGIYAQATTDPPSTGAQPARLYNTPAIISMAAGGALIVVGALWWVHDRHASSAPTAAVVPGGGTIGWAGAF